jgi:XTP/dITP diphosphohydrolase
MKKIDIVIASGNKDKIREYKELFKDFPINVTSIKEENIELNVEETGTTFLENSIIKARYIAGLTNKIVIADDSGICVHALNDFPGVYSARFMEGQSYDLKNKALN